MSGESLPYRHERNAREDGGGDAARARANQVTQSSRRAWTDGGVTGGNRRRSRRLIVTDQKGAEAEYKGLGKDGICGAYAAAGVAAADDNNREDPELFARLGYGGDGGENCAG